MSELSVDRGDTVEMLRTRLKEKLSAPAARVLIMLDDVVQAEDVRLQLTERPQSRGLIATRKLSAAQKLGIDGRNQIIQLEDGPMHRFQPVAAECVVAGSARQAACAEGPVLRIGN